MKYRCGRLSFIHFVLTVGWMTGSFFVTYAQGLPECPPNIGFEKGNFNGWECSTGQLSSTGSLASSSTGVVAGRHTLISGARYRSLDPYGGFPIVCPNGSNYTVMLGNNGTGGQTESMTYTFKVPNDAKDYSIVYNYAVVLENPSHLDFEQPRFTAKVFNVSTGVYIQCGSFEFVSSSAIPGFQLSDVAGNRNSDIYYKPWSAVSLNLSAYSGQTLRLEFTTADCTKGGHFGYAYVDVNESCATQITGNAICPGAKDSLVLQGPVGLKEYYWFNSDFSQVLGRSDKLTLSPIPNVGSRYPLRIVPYDGFGCEDTVYAIISSANELLTIQSPDTLSSCDVVNLSDPSVVAGSTSGLKFTYYKDSLLTTLVPNAISLTTGGTYYIKGTFITGCVISKPVNVIIGRTSQLIVNPPAPVCGVGSVDLTLPQVTAGSEPGLTLTYWQDDLASIPIPNPKVVNVTNSYFIKSVNAQGCASIKSVQVIMAQIPSVITTAQIGCHFVNLTLPGVTAGSTPALTFTYWNDPAAISPVTRPDSVISSNTYYIKGTSIYGCFAISRVVVTIYTDPVFAVKDPVPVIYPGTINITTVPPVISGLTYSFFKDARGTVPLLNPFAIGLTGNYYVRAVNPGGCSTIKQVKVVILPPENPVVTSVNTFTPNGDGVNDNFKLDITGNLRIRYFRVFNRWGTPVFETVDLNESWDGKTNGKPAATGTYYWVFNSFDDYRNREVKRSGYITLVR